MKRLLLLFLLSGLGAVAIETIWMRWLRLLLGATAPAASTTLVAFFAGHALGAAWAARWAARWRRPLVTYGRLELAAAASAAAVPLVLGLGEAALAPLYDTLRETPAALTAARFALALAATLPAAFCFGAAFPAIGAAAAPALARLGPRGAALYAVDTLGAAAGTAAAAFWLPGVVGVRATYGLAIALLVAVGAGALAIARRGGGVTDDATKPPRADARRSASKRSANRRSPVSAEMPAFSAPALLALAGLSGLCPFAAQVLLVQSFAQVLNQSSLAFGAVLVVVLLSIAAASTAVALLVQRGLRAGRDERTALGVALVLAALATAAFPSLLARATGGLGYVGASDAGLPYLAAALGTVARTAGPRLLAVDSSAAGVVAVVERNGERLIRVDGHYALGRSAERVHHERQAHLPLLLAPGARRVLHAGSATGISAGAALAHPIESLALVELLPAVARAGARWFSEFNRNVYEDSRTTVVLDDARNFLATTSERFDVVIADLFVPWHAGAGALYAREHFAAVRARLEPGGIFCQWLPLYQLSEPELRIVATTFLDVFPETAVFRGDFFGRFPIIALVGFTGAPPDPHAVSAGAATLGRAGERDRWIAEPLGPWALYVGPLAPLGRALAGDPRNRDDAPALETLAAAGHAGGGRGKLDPVVGLAWVGFAETIQAAARAKGDPLWPALPAPAAQARDGGALLQRAGALYGDGRHDAAARVFAAAARRLPAHLVKTAPADPTAAELWHTQ